MFYKDIWIYVAMFELLKRLWLSSKYVHVTLSVWINLCLKVFQHFFSLTASLTMVKLHDGAMPSVYILGHVMSLCNKSYSPWFSKKQTRFHLSMTPDFMFWKFPCKWYMYFKTTFSDLPVQIRCVYSCLEHKQLRGRYKTIRCKFVKDHQWIPAGADSIPLHMACGIFNEQ